MPNHTALRRQSNMNWLAMIYRIDREPSPAEIRRVLNVFNDSRLEYDDIEKEARVKVGIAMHRSYFRRFF